MMCRQEANGKRRRIEVNRQPNDTHDYHLSVTTRFDRSITCVVTKSYQVFDRVIRSLMENNARQRLVVGLGVETKPSREAVSTIQVCYHHHCLIYHMFEEAAFIPHSLRKFLFNPDITFVGYHLKKRLKILKSDAGFDLDVPYIDLNDLAEDLYPVDNDLSLLSAFVLEYVHDEMRPDIEWDLEDLSSEQVEYSSFSTYLSLQIGNLLLRAEAGNLPRNCIFRWQEEEHMIRQVHKVQIFDRTIVATATKHLAIAEKWIDDVAHYRHLYPCIGFDIELITIENQPRIGTVQFCVRSRCLIIQMEDPKYLPNLERFLLESNNTFVGVDIRRKMRMLIDSLLFANGGRLKCVDLGMCAMFLHRRAELNNAGHEELARVVLETRVEMPADVDADWGRPWLSVAQVEHACIRAAVSYELGSRMLPPREGLAIP